MEDTTAIDWAREELVRLIEIASLSGQEHEAMEYLAGRCAQLGFPVDVQSIDGAGPNVLVGWDEHPSLLLTAHIDTIVPEWEWSGRARVEDAVVYGLGAQDDKGCAVSILLGALLARDGGVPLERLPVALGFVVDEEVGGKGSRALADTLQPRYVVASEGTELDIAVTETGFVDGTIRVEGRTVHGSLIEEGDNAVEKAARLLLELLELPFTRFAHPIAGSNLASVQRMTSVTPMNAIPDRADLYVSARVFGEPSLEEVQRQIEGLCARFDATFALKDRGGWWETPSDAPLVRALSAASEQAIGRRPGFTRMPSWTDAHSFADRSDSEVVVFGPGHLRAAHRPDEHIDLREVVRCARVFAGLIADAGTLAATQPARMSASMPASMPRTNEEGTT
ncbi:MAG: M20/M25/M40 family metallo-hydrolase [Actinomycetota bacterium]